MAGADAQPDLRRFQRDASSLFVKICGVRDAETARVCAEAGADAIGLVFAQGSPRTVTEAEASAARIAFDRPEMVMGVFRDPSCDDPQLAAHGGAVQLHGRESPEFVSELRQRLNSEGRAGRVIFKAVEPDEALLARWVNVTGIDAILIDSAVAGSGAPHDRRWLERLGALVPTVRAPIILAGGLTPENVGEAIELVGPAGVDVSSGVESVRGVKDHAKIRAFIAAARAAHARRR